MNFKPAPLTGDELLVLFAISEHLRQLSKGIASGRKSIVSILASRMGRKPKPSLKALVYLSDLQRMKPDTLRELAKSVNRPEMGEVWVELWNAVEHPRNKEFEHDSS